MRPSKSAIADFDAFLVPQSGKRELRYAWPLGTANGEHAEFAPGRPKARTPLALRQVH